MILDVDVCILRTSHRQRENHFKIAIDSVECNGFGMSLKNENTEHILQFAILNYIELSIGAKRFCPAQLTKTK